MMNDKALYTSKERAVWYALYLSIITRRTVDEACRDMEITRESQNKDVRKGIYLAEPTGSILCKNRKNRK